MNSPADTAQILITGAPRSGGSLLCSLLDGHPEVKTFPFKARFAKRFDYPISVADETRTLRDHLVAVGRHDLFLRALLGKKRSQVYGDKHKFAASLEQHCPESGFAAVESISNAFFEAIGKCNHAAGGMAWHATNMQLGNLESALGVFPRLRVVGVVRHPLDTLLSHKHYKKNWRLELHSELFINVYSILRLARLGFRFPAQVSLVRYEELLTRPRETMQGLAKRFAIENDPSLLKPTLLGNPWTANSSYRSNRVEGEITPLSFRFLGNKELLDFMSEDTTRRDVLEACGYYLQDPYFLPGEPDLKNLDSLSDMMIARWHRDYLLAARSVRPSIRSRGAAVLGRFRR
jgi:hypothetical protein